MKQICLQDAGLDAAPRTTEVSLYPDIDNTFTPVSYEGERLVTRRRQILGYKQLGSMQDSKQGMAIYGDILVRMANVSTSTTHIIYRIMPSGILEQVATFTDSSVGHSNALQFAPSLEAGQAYPYLYVANLDLKCSVLSIAADFSVTKVQTITIDVAGAGGNILMGDDGYIWSVTLDSNDHYHFVKFRRVAVSEGDVTLTDADVLDEWSSQESWPYATFVWQGMMVKFGKVWFVYGQTQNSSQRRGIAVYDTATHAFVTDLHLDGINYEPEDVDAWNDSLILATYSAPYYLLKF